MKPGDKVFFFDNLLQKIMEGVIQKVTNEGHCYILADKGPSPMFCLFYEVFPTREALCEHYRKIFD